MTDTDEFETALETYRRVDRPLWRLFTSYGPGKAVWLIISLVTSVLAYGTVPVTSIALGTTLRSYSEHHPNWANWLTLQRVADIVRGAM